MNMFKKAVEKAGPIAKPITDSAKGTVNKGMESVKSSGEALKKASEGDFKGAGSSAKDAVKSGAEAGKEGAKLTAQGAGAIYTTGTSLAAQAAEKAKKEKAAAEKKKKAEAAKKEEERKTSDGKAIEDITKSLKTAASDIDAAGKETMGKIDETKKQADDALKLYKSTLDEKNKLLDQKAKDIENLSKWHQGIVTSYEELSDRYRNAVTGLDAGERRGMENQAKTDYNAMSGLGAQAAGIMAGAGGGPKTGLQQQLMGAAFQQQATSAYSSSMKNIASVDEQRRQMQFAMAQAANTDERSNRQLGFNMNSSQIQQGIGVLNNQIGMAGSQYGASMQNVALGQQNAMDKYGIGLNTISARTSAQTYAPTAQMALNNKEMMGGFMNRQLDIQEKMAAKGNSMLPMLGTVGGAVVGGIWGGGPAGAMAGAAVGGAAGTAASNWFQV